MPLMSDARYWKLRQVMPHPEPLHAELLEGAREGYFLGREFAEATECQLATLEDLERRPRFPRGELARHRKIAARMVEVCRLYQVETIGTRGFVCTRLREALAKLPTEAT